MQNNIRGVLFMCVANSARSQMAEGIARAISPEGVVIFSAGSEPTRVSPLAVKAMSEIGIDISSHHSKPVAEVPLDRLDLVVTLCDEDVCPALPPNVASEHWPMSDPAATEGDDLDRLDAFRRVRDALREKVSALF